MMLAVPMPRTKEYAGLTGQQEAVINQTYVNDFSSFKDKMK